MQARWFKARSRKTMELLASWCQSFIRLWKRSCAHIGYAAPPKRTSAR